MLTKEEKIKLTGIGLFFIVGLSFLVLAYSKTYLEDSSKPLSELDYKRSRSVTQDKNSFNLLKRLKGPEGYDFEIFSNGFKNLTYITRGPFEGFLAIDKGRGALFQLVDNTGDNVADFNILVAEGLSGVSSVDYTNKKIFLSLFDGVYIFDYNDSDYTIDDSLRIVDFDKGSSGNFKMTESNEGVIVSNGSVSLEDFSNRKVESLTDLGEIFYFDFGADRNSIWLSDNSDGPRLINVDRFGNKHYFNLDYNGRVNGVLVIDTDKAPVELQGDLLVALEDRIVLVNIENNTVIDMYDVVTGFEDGNGNPVDLSYDDKGSLYIADNRTGSVIKMFKK